MDMVVKTNIQYKSGMVVGHEGKAYKVLSSIDLKWLGFSEEVAFLTNLKYIGEYKDEDLILDKNVPHGTNAEQNSSALN